MCSERLRQRSRTGDSGTARHPDRAVGNCGLLSPIHRARSSGVHRAVLFDVDGVLLDSMTTYQRVWHEWAGLCNLDPTSVWAMTPGRRPSDTIRAVAPHLDAEAECRRLALLLDAELEQLVAMPGAQVLLQAVPRHRWALVTSNTEAVVRSCFKRLGLPSPGLVIDGAAVAEGKPHPEGFLAASKHLGVQPANCLVVEDAPSGVAAGRAAGMTVYAIHSNCLAGQLGGAHRLFPSLAAATLAVVAWVGGQDISDDRSAPQNAR